MSDSVKKIVVLFSGAGGNLASIIEKLHKKPLESEAECSFEVVAAITNNALAQGLQRAKEHKIVTEVLDHRAFDSRESFDTALLALVESFRADLVVLAGFMRILTPVFTSKVKAINLHPSLLPKFKGAQAIERSFESNDRICGVSVHFVSEELDAGTIIVQEEFEKSSNETLESFSMKIKAIEYEILPAAIKKVLCPATKPKQSQAR